MVYNLFMHPSKFVHPFHMPDMVSYERGQDNRSRNHFIISNLLSLSQLNKKNAPRTAGRFSVSGGGGGMGEEREL